MLGGSACDLALRWLRQEDCEYKTSLGCIVRSCLRKIKGKKTFSSSICVVIILRINLLKKPKKQNFVYFFSFRQGGLLFSLLLWSVYCFSTMTISWLRWLNTVSFALDWSYQSLGEKQKLDEWEKEGRSKLIGHKWHFHWFHVDIINHYSNKIVTLLQVEYWRISSVFFYSVHIFRMSWC